MGAFHKRRVNIKLRVLLAQTRAELAFEYIFLVTIPPSNIWKRRVKLRAVEASEPKLEIHLTSIRTPKDNVRACLIAYFARGHELDCPPLHSPISELDFKSFSKRRRFKVQSQLILEVMFVRACRNGCLSCRPFLMQPCTKFPLFLASALPDLLGATPL